MRINVDRDYLLPYFTAIEPIENNGYKTFRFEIGDSINVYYADNNDINLNSIHFAERTILNITSKIVVLESHGRCYYITIEELEKRIKI